MESASIEYYVLWTLGNTMAYFSLHKLERILQICDTIMCTEIQHCGQYERYDAVGTFGHSEGKPGIYIGWQILMCKAVTISPASFRSRETLLGVYCVILNSLLTCNVICFQFIGSSLVKVIVCRKVSAGHCRKHLSDDFLLNRPNGWKFSQI